jgi:hypothetical protein
MRAAENKCSKVINIEQKFWNSERQRFVHCLSLREDRLIRINGRVRCFFIGLFWLGETEPHLSFT